MKLSTRGRYGLRALIDLAVLLKKNKCVSIREVAVRQGLSAKYLEALFNVLKNAGIVQSYRGAKGGYFLRRPPNKITALEVLESIEGPISIVSCCIEKEYCNLTGKCKTFPLWKRINQKIIAELKSKTIKDLM